MGNLAEKDLSPLVPLLSVENMSRRMDEVVDYVRKSRNRLDVLKALGRGMASTNKVAARTKLQVRSVRSTLYDLKKKGLVEEAAGKARRPLIYKTTGLGKAVLKMKNARGTIRWKGSSRQKRIARRVKRSL